MRLFDDPLPLFLTFCCIIFVFSGFYVAFHTHITCTCLYLCKEKVKNFGMQKTKSQAR